MLTTRLREVLLTSETTATRFWIAVISLGYGMFFMNFPNVGIHDYLLSLQFLPPAIWSILFLTTGSSMMFGLFIKKFNLLLLILESGVGCFAWVSLGITTGIENGIPGLSMFVSMISIWILMRYPAWR